jgi:uncharacterized membrane protein YeaQ/YmgE (transglycosylase-associated protein family)
MGIGREAPRPPRVRVGCTGALAGLIGGLLFGLLGITAGGLLGGLITATVGAIVLIALLRLIKRGT